MSGDMVQLTKDMHNCIKKYITRENLHQKSWKDSISQGAMNSTYLLKQFGSEKIMDSVKFKVSCITIEHKN